MTTILLPSELARLARATRVATRFQLAGFDGSTLSFGTDSGNGIWVDRWASADDKGPARQSKTQIGPSTLVAFLKEFALPSSARDAAVEGVMNGYVPQGLPSVTARFNEGPKGEKEFQAWKAKQPEAFQEEWDQQNEAHRDQFKSAMYAEGESVPLEDLPKELQDNVENPPPSVQRLKDEMEESQESEESMMVKPDQALLPVERMAMRRQRLTWAPLSGSKEAAGGLYGFTKATQKDVEVTIRKARKTALGIARTAYGKDQRVLGFLQAHAKRSKSASAKMLLGAMSEIGPKVASKIAAAQEAEDMESDERRNRMAADNSAAKEGGDKIARGMYGHPAKTARLGLRACSEIRAFVGEIASDLHGRRQARHDRITGYLKEHVKAAKCGYTRMLLSSYPDGPEGKTASDKSAAELSQAMKDNQFQPGGGKKEDEKDDKKGKSGSADFNPEEIGETETGGALENDAEEAPYMGDNFTQQETNELLHKQETGKLKSGQVAKNAAPSTVQGWLEWQE